MLTAVEPSLRTPKKLSTCPSAMMTAMPEVKPVMTGAGMKETSRPSRKRPASSKMTPASNVAAKTPCME